MAQNTTISLAAATWTQLTNSNVDAIRAVNLGTEAISIQAVVGEVTPTGNSGIVPLLPGQILAADLTLAQLFPGVAGANRVYAYSPVAAKVSISHA